MNNEGEIVTTESKNDVVVEAREMVARWAYEQPLAATICDSALHSTLIPRTMDLVTRLCDELTEERRLRAELKQIAQTGISEVSSVSATLKENAVRDTVDRFRSSIVSLIEAKADGLARTSIAAEQNARTISELRELAKLIGEIK